MSNDSKLITIYISQNKADILTKIPIIEALLNSAGIEYFSLNENVTNLYGGLNILSRGIEIQVAEENVEKANELINADEVTFHCKCSPAEAQTITKIHYVWL